MVGQRLRARITDHDPLSEFSIQLSSKCPISRDTVTHLWHRLIEATLQRPAMNLTFAHCGKRCSVRSMSALTQDRDSLERVERRPLVHRYRRPSSSTDFPFHKTFDSTTILVDLPTRNPTHTGQGKAAVRINTYVTCMHPNPSKRRFAIPHPLARLN